MSIHQALVSNRASSSSFNCGSLQPRRGLQPSKRKRREQHSYRGSESEICWVVSLHLTNLWLKKKSRGGRKTTQKSPASHVSKLGVLEGHSFGSKLVPWTVRSFRHTKVLHKKKQKSSTMLHSGPLMLGVMMMMNLSSAQIQTSRRKTTQKGSVHPSILTNVYT